jgi:germination protein M
MTGRILRFSPIVPLAFALAACGSTKTVTVTQTETVTTTVTQSQPAETTALRAYFLRDGKVAPVLREVPRTKAVLSAALAELGLGPSPEEHTLGLTSDLDAVQLLGMRDGVLSAGGDFPRTGLAQVVYTATQFPTVKAVEHEGKRYTRADFEDLTPSILVESPLPFQTVRSPLRATGTANTFEATFEYDLVDAEGKVIAHHFETATSGSGTRGTFDFTVPFTVARSGPGKLVVFESSAANGRRIHIVEIPLRLEP